jgi:hypothetical protein
MSQMGQSRRFCYVGDWSAHLPKAGRKTDRQQFGLVPHPNVSGFPGEPKSRSRALTSLGILDNM